MVGSPHVHRALRTFTKYMRKVFAEITICSTSWKRRRPLSTLRLRNDAAALENIFSADYMFVNGSGGMVTKAQRLGDLKSGDVKYESVSIADQTVRTYGNMAVAIARVTVSATISGVSPYPASRSIVTGSDTFATMRARFSIASGRDNACPSPQPCAAATDQLPWRALLRRRLLPPERYRHPKH